MASIVAVSSWVAFGHVGLSAAVPVMQALGHSVAQLPTVILSNHPGWPHVSGAPVPIDTLSRMLQAWQANAWLADVQTLLIGYLPTQDHVTFACDVVERLRSETPRIRVVVDPILGDTPKGLYVSQESAKAVLDRLLPMADVLTPNVFELGWLSALPVDTLDDVLAAAKGLLRQGTLRQVIVTSPPISPTETGVLVVESDAVSLHRSPLLDGVPNGTGDVLSALIAAGLPPDAALGQLQSLIAASTGHAHLRIAETSRAWLQASPCAADTCPDPNTR